MEWCGSCPGCVTGGVAGAEARGLVWPSAVASPQHRIRGMTGRAQGTWSVLPGTFLSRQPPAPTPFPPTPSTVPIGGCLSLCSADAILRFRTCQWRGAWAWGPTSCREAEGLESRSGAWEHRPSKQPGQVPLAVGKRGLQGHGGQLNIGTRGGGSGSCQPQGALRLLPTGAGTGRRSGVSEMELCAPGQPVVDSGACSEDRSLDLVSSLPWRG